MRPAFSVILLTTLIGAGQGLFLALFTVAALRARSACCRRSTGHAFYAQGSADRAALLAAGLVASFFHLGRPERAWRSAAQWRTSWLSREVIVLPAFMGSSLSVRRGASRRLEAGADAHCRRGMAIDATVVLGAVGTVLAFALFVCTAMIYACLPFLQEWATPLTVVNYMLLGSASGFTLAAAFAAALAPRSDTVSRRLGARPHAAALVARVASLMRNARLQAQVDAADRDRHQASAHRAEIAGIHGRLVQHARVLPRHGRRRAAVDQVAVSCCRCSRCRWCCSALGGSAAARAARRLSSFSTSGCSPSAGSSSPRPTTRRTSTTRRSPEPAMNQEIHLA